MQLLRREGELVAREEELRVRGQELLTLVDQKSHGLEQLLVQQVWEVWGTLGGEDQIRGCSCQRIFARNVAES